MAVQVSYPGVYIDEFAPGAPIQGVGTSVAAFIGVTARGVIQEPTKVTSWDQFTTMFGAGPAPGFYLWYAVRGNPSEPWGAPQLVPDVNTDARENDAHLAADGCTLYFTRTPTGTGDLVAAPMITSP